MPDVERISELTDAEWKAIAAARVATIIVGGDPLVPYDVVALAREVKRLRDENAKLKASLAAWQRTRIPTGPVR